MTLYAVGYTTLTGRFSKSYDSNVSSIGATSRTCTKYASGTCSITLPTISVASGYSAGKWFSNTDLGTSSYPTSVSATYISYGKSASSSQNISQDTYYSAFAGSTVTITITKTNAVTTASTTKSCTRYGNGSCNVTLPTLTAATNYSSPFFASSSTGSTSRGASGATVSVSSSATWYASASRNLYISVIKYSSYSTYGVNTLTGYTTNSGTSSSAVAQSSQGTRYAHCLIYGNGTSCSTTAPTATAYTGFSSVVFASTTSASSITSTNSFAQGSTITIKTSGSSSGTSVLANSSYYAWGTKTVKAYFYYAKNSGSCNNSSCSGSDTTSTQSCTAYGNNSCTVYAPSIYPYTGKGYETAYWGLDNAFATSGLNSGASVSISGTRSYTGVGYRSLTVYFKGSTGVTVKAYDQWTCIAYGSQSSCTAQAPGTNNLTFAANYGPPAWYSTTNGASSGTQLGTNATTFSLSYTASKTTTYYVMATYTAPAASKLVDYIVNQASVSTGSTSWNQSTTVKQQCFRAKPIATSLKSDMEECYYAGDMPENWIKFNAGEAWRIIGAFYEYTGSSWEKLVKIVRTASSATSSFGSTNFFNSTVRATLHNTVYAGLQDKQVLQSVRIAAGGTDNDTASMAPAINWFRTVEAQASAGGTAVEPINILYPSDYALTYMEGYDPWYYSSNNTSAPTKKSWMHSFTTGGTHLNLVDTASGTSFFTSTPGGIDDAYTTNQYKVIPVVWLKNGFKRSGGVGGSGNMYTGNI